MNYRKRFFVDPATKLRLAAIDPAETGRHATALAAKEEIDGHCRKLTHLQARLYAQKQHAVLIVLQAMDAGGKDGTVSHVFSTLNPQAARVAAFKAPTEAEKAHDFLWRVHREVPAKGEIVIFNRSHYEDVLVPRVHGLIDKAIWTARYEQIRAFETLLAKNGTTILKFFLHISKEEQLARFAARLEDPVRNWKISEADYMERALWDRYREAFEDALQSTSAAHAPWYVIPANHKWFRNLVVSSIVVEAMEELGLAFPKPSIDLAKIRQQYHAAEEEAQVRKVKPAAD